MRSSDSDMTDTAGIAFEEVLGEFLQRSEAGENPDLYSYLERYPQYRDELLDFLKNDAWLKSPNSLPDLHGSSSAAPYMQLAGQCINRYEILEVVGCGGMGVVYRANDQQLQREVALKFLAAGQFAGAEEVRRIRLEAEAVARLDHPHLMPIYEVGTWQGLPYLVLPLLDRKDLQERLEAKPLSPYEAATLVRDLARGIEHAHRRGVIHRDLKPANVLFAVDGRPVVADFGLAKAPRSDGSCTTSGMLLGTPFYMAPEQADGKAELSVATDVYGLGGILYAALTGKPPHHGPTVVEVLRHVMQEEVEPPRSATEQIPRDLQAICMRCLRREPSDRYASAQALVDDLERFLSGEPALAADSGPLEALARPLRRDAHRGAFRSWGRALLGFGFVILLAHVLMLALRLSGFGFGVGYVAPRVLMFGSLLAILAYYRQGKIGPQSVVERPLWSIWVGYLGGLSTSTLLLRAWGIPSDHLFAISSVLSGFGFIATGGHAWGGCYVIGACFLMLSLVMPFLPGMELWLGGAWFLALAALARRYWSP